MTRVMALVLLLAAPQAGADVDAAKYPASTFAALLAEHRGHEAAGASSIEAQDVKATVQARGAGRMRKLSRVERRFLAAWAEAQGQPGIPKLFRRAVLVEDEGVSRWLLLQDALVRPWRDEIGHGTGVELRVMLMGEMEGQPMIAVNAFSALAPAAAPTTSS